MKGIRMWPLHWSWLIPRSELRRWRNPPVREGTAR
jgi:hypothetical protein